MDNLARNTQIFFWKFSFHSTLPPEFLEFPVEWFAFGNSTAFGISGKFCGKNLYHLPLFPNFRKFCLNGKRPLSSHVKPVLWPMVITEPTVPSARLLGVGSKFLKWWMAICMDWQNTWHFRGQGLHSQFCFQEREIYYTCELIVIVDRTCPDHLLNSPSSLDTSVSAAWMVSCALSNSIFSCVASWVLNSNLISKKTEIKEKDNWVAVNKNIQASITRFSETRREGSI